MHQFEYRFDNVEIETGAVVKLNELGQDGWQVVQYFPPSQALGEPATVLLMRAIEWRRMRAAK